MLQRQQFEIALSFCQHFVSVSVTSHSSLAHLLRRFAHQGFESSAKGLRLETIGANVESSEEYRHVWNADIPCEKKGTPFRYIHQVGLEETNTGVYNYLYQIFLAISFFCCSITLYEIYERIAFCVFNCRAANFLDSAKHNTKIQQCFWSCC